MTRHDRRRSDEAARQIHRAARDTGFFYVANHGVAEEATGIEGETYAAMVARLTQTKWTNIDLTVEEKKITPDMNRLGLGTEIDFDLHNFREWVWVIRTAKAMKKSALLICGMAHTISVASKFSSVGFNVETHLYFDNADGKLIADRTEGETKVTPS